MIETLTSLQKKVVRKCLTLSVVSLCLHKTKYSKKCSNKSCFHKIQYDVLKRLKFQAALKNYITKSGIKF